MGSYEATMHAACIPGTGKRCARAVGHGSFRSEAYVAHTGEVQGWWTASGRSIPAQPVRWDTRNGVILLDIAADIWYMYVLYRMLSTPYTV